MKFIFFKFVAVFVTVLCVSGLSFAQTETEKGIELYEKGDYSTAIETLEKVTQTDRKDGIAWRFLGMAYARKGFLKQALETFDEADNFEDKDLNKFYDTPVKVISKSQPRYTKDARRNLISGKVKLAVEFGADGKVRYITIIYGLPDGLTESAIEAALKLKFKPATKKEHAVTVIKFIEYTFDIY